MIRGLLTIGFVLFLAAAAVWAYRHYGSALPAPRQAEQTPTVIEPTQNVPAPPVYQQPAPAPAPAPAPLVQEPPVPPVPAPAPLVQEQISDPQTPRIGKRTHLVSAGETLWEISRKYFNSAAYVEQIADANHLDSPNRLRPGMVLVLPEIPGVSTREDSRVPIRRAEEPEQVRATPQGLPPMPPTLSRAVPAE